MWNLEQKFANSTQNFISFQTTVFLLYKHRLVSCESYVTFVEDLLHATYEKRGLRETYKNGQMLARLQRSIQCKRQVPIKKTRMTEGSDGAGGGHWWVGTGQGERECRTVPSSPHADWTCRPPSICVLFPEVSIILYMRSILLHS